MRGLKIIAHCPVKITPSAACAKERISSGIFEQLRLNKFVHNYLINTYITRSGVLIEKEYK